MPQIVVSGLVGKRKKKKNGLERGLKNGVKRGEN